MAGGNSNPDSDGDWPGRATLRDAFELHFRGRQDHAVLDLGCDHKPCFPPFRPEARRDVVRRSRGLEHAPDPASRSLISNFLVVARRR